MPKEELMKYPASDLAEALAAKLQEAKKNIESGKVEVPAPDVEGYAWFVEANTPQTFYASQFDALSVQRINFNQYQAALW
jgi:hypothetical protein